MNTGQTIFAQLMEFIPTCQFQLCVDRYYGHRYVKGFSCWDQFLCLAFAQLTYRHSLRDIEACLRAQPAKLDPMGFRLMLENTPRLRPVSLAALALLSTCLASRGGFPETQSLRGWRISPGGFCRDVCDPGTIECSGAKALLRPQSSALFDHPHVSSRAPV